MREVLGGREFPTCDIVPADDRGGARLPDSRGAYQRCGPPAKTIYLCVAIC